MPSFASTLLPDTVLDAFGNGAGHSEQDHKSSSTWVLIDFVGPCECTWVITIDETLLLLLGLVCLRSVVSDPWDSANASARFKPDALSLRSWQSHAPVSAAELFQRLSFCNVVDPGLDLLHAALGVGCCRIDFELEVVISFIYR